MDLPPGSPLIHWTLENPWPLAAALGVLAAIAWRGRPRWGVRRSTRIVAAALGMALLTVATALTIETAGERVDRLTRSLVEAAVAGDDAAVGALLADDLVLIVGTDRTGLTRDDLLDRVPALDDLVVSNALREVDGVGLPGNRAESVFAQTTSLSVGYPTPNAWRCRWRHETDGEWRVYELVWEKWNLNQTPSASLLDQ